ncbi:hypothetical protein Fmac_028669 [Flemingia macrophylla]|uniref:Uncharacterized protein n=1 Tax=Flemingia macrophylla TaxID=520843 RepID=A0ABD1L9L7_9FABA
MATDTSAETRKLEGKLDALMKLVTQLAANRSLPLFKESVTSVLPMTTTLVLVLLRGNLEWMSILIFMLQTPIADHHSSNDKALDREDGSQFSARNDAIFIIGVHDVATDTSAKTRKLESKLALGTWCASVVRLEGKLDALVNLVTQLAANQKSASVARVCGIRSSNDPHTSVCPSSQQSGVDEHPEESKLDAIVNLVTLLAANQKHPSVARVCGIRSSNDHHSSVCPSSQQSGVDKHSEAYAQFSSRNDAIVIRGVHDVPTDTSAETRKLEGKLDALMNLVTQLAANQKPASIVRVCGIRSSNDHHTSVCPSSQQSGMDKHPEAYATNTYSRPPQQQRQGT